MYIFAPLFDLMKIGEQVDRHWEENGEDHHSSSQNTPLREDAFALSDEEKIKRIQGNVKDILEFVDDSSTSQGCRPDITSSRK